MKKVFKTTIYALSIVGITMIIGLITGYISLTADVPEIKAENNMKQIEIEHLYGVIDNQNQSIQDYEDDIEQLEENNLTIQEQLAVKTDVLNQIEAREDRELYMGSEEVEPGRSKEEMAER